MIELLENCFGKQNTQRQPYQTLKASGGLFHFSFYLNLKIISCCLFLQVACYEQVSLFIFGSRLEEDRHQNIFFSNNDHSQTGWQSEQHNEIRTVASRDPVKTHFKTAVLFFKTLLVEDFQSAVRHFSLAAQLCASRISDTVPGFASTPEQTLLLPNMRCSQTEPSMRMAALNIPVLPSRTGGHVGSGLFYHTVNDR